MTVSMEMVCMAKPCPRKNQSEHSDLPQDHLAIIIMFICYASLSTTSVSFMKERLDQDSMGIILLQNFLKEFFPGEV